MSQPTNLKSDLDLAAEFTASGNPEVLGILYQRYMHLVYGVCLKYFKNRDAAKEAVIQMFEKLMVEVPKQQVANFKPWLYVVTKNFCLMELRKQKTGPGHELLFMENLTSFVENEPDLHPLDNDDGQELADALQQCIAKLRDDQRRCIELFYFDNRCYNDIAAMQGIDVKKVKSYIQNGKRNLKICLENQHEAAEYK
ncbi:MAG: sigma-70 family RNA polymerase sigma factor [Breznakibacter sp.]